MTTGRINGRKKKVNLVVDKGECKPKGEILRIENLSANDHRGVEVVKNLNLVVNGGEILGIAGVDGNGQSEFLEVLTGLRKAKSGKIVLGDKDIYGKAPREITESGVGHIPEDRHKRGLILKYSLFENSVLGIHKNKPFSKGIVMNYNEIKAHCDKLIDEV